MRQTGKRGSGQWEEISWAEAIKLISDKFKSAAHSDIWVPVRPDTDGAMLLAMCNYTIDNDLIDYDYLRNHSVAKEAIKDFAVEFAAKECDVPAGRLWSRSVRRRLTSTSSAPLPTEWASMACISQTKNICANTWTHPKTWKLAVATTL